jgi:hypothetical protein
MEKKEPQSVRKILANIFAHAAKEGEGKAASDPRDSSSSTPAPAEPTKQEPYSGRYDFDLAEFPLFHFYKNRLEAHDRAPLVYSDTITGKDGQPVTREWKAYAGPFGFGGSSTHVLLFDLLQLYVEQGCRGSQIQFGSLRALLQRRGTRNPSKSDYDRIRRDINILRGYDFHCKNAFWDRQKQAYVDMNWRLFGSVFYFKESPVDGESQLPFGFIEISPVLQQIARTRGFFTLGFDSGVFYTLKPLEQRLAIYLAKKFTSQKLHRRYVVDLAKALPIEAARPRDTRRILKLAAQGLLDKRLPILHSFALEKNAVGRWLAVFHRRAAPQQHAPFPRYAAEELTPGLSALVERVVDATGNGDDRLWWTQCVKRLGQGGVDRALGQLKEARQLGSVRNPSALLTKIFKDLASEYQVTLH